MNLKDQMVPLFDLRQQRCNDERGRATHALANILVLIYFDGREDYHDNGNDSASASVQVRALLKQNRLL